MQENLKLSRLKSNIISLEDYQNNISSNENYDFLLYSDNILEGISLLNSLVDSGSEILEFYGIVYQPIDQPIYIFKDQYNKYYSIKICGAFSNWKLPDEVKDLESFIDIPDFAIFSIQKHKTIVAGENTETASVGNSQWQREGRKLGAAKNSIPFIYQTFYSGKDESQDTVREPTSLQAFNHLVYSIRYKTPSVVIYLDNNFEDGLSTRSRPFSNGSKFLVDYIKCLLVCSVNPNYQIKKKQIEREIFKHMLSYMSEGKLKSNNKIEINPRFLSDFPIANDETIKNLIYENEKFIEELVDFLNNSFDEHQFRSKYDILKFNYNKMSTWNSYDSKPFINDLLDYLSLHKSSPLSYNSKSKVGICKTDDLLKFLEKKFPNDFKSNIHKFENYSETILIPLRIHKKSNNILTYSPDPESGEIAAFIELLGFDLQGNKIRSVLGYCIVEPPNNFDFTTKKDTKLYKSSANYIDLIIFEGKSLYSNFVKSELSNEKYIPVNILDEIPKNCTEEVAIVSTFLNLSTIKADWDLCFIHTHHSSWQQLMVYKQGILNKMKINRVSSKVDLIMQSKDEVFFVAEGKKKYKDFFSSLSEIKKISKSMGDVDKYIDSLVGHKTKKINSFLCNIELPQINSEFFLQKELATIKESIQLRHLNKIIETEYVVIAVFSLNNTTYFKTFFSENFNIELKELFYNVFEK